MTHHMKPQTILDTIGNTPLVEITRLNPNPHVKVFAKLEYFNPGGSIKDRAALSMIEDGERSGQLTPEKTVVEATSGNTGIGLALVCAVKGYRLLLTMSESVSVERQKILKARGAQIRLTPSHLSTDGAIEEVYRLVRENPKTYFMTDQFNNPANWRAHYDGTAVEIWEQTQGQVTSIVATLGTSGTLMGVSRRIKEYNPKVTVVGVEPYMGHKIQGLKNLKESYCPEIFEKSRLDIKIHVDDEQAFDTARRLAKEEGLFVGMSSGAAMAAALREAEQMTEGTVVAVLPDSGERYLSTSLFKEKDKVALHLFNTRSRAKEPFEPQNTGKVTIYTCGPTAFAPLNISEIRRFLFSDLLCRYLTYRGYSVRHMMNIADLDDKTIRRSEETGLSLDVFAEKLIQQFMQDFKTLGIESVEKFPRASQHIDDMVDLTDQLISKGFAYEKLRSVYFDISRFKDYGKLSGIDLDKIRLGATVDLDDYEKDNPRDFTLFKRAKLSELKRGIYTKTKWGNVRPSWHIQCAAISMKYFGPHYDIHTSGRELVFPHHDNELAITEAFTGTSVAHYWLHCDRVLVDGKKINEEDSGHTLKDLMAKGYSDKEIRYWLLSHHYRKPIFYSPGRLDIAKKSLDRLNTCIHALQRVSSGGPYADVDQLLYDIRHGFISAMDDDLNVSAALAVIYRIVKKVNTLVQQQQLGKDDAHKICHAFQGIDAVLNVFDFTRPDVDETVQQLINERNKARAEKNWQLADAIRQKLVARGIVVRDRKVPGNGH